MSDTIQCDTHGETPKTFVCSHLADTSSAGLGFNRDEPSEHNPFPDAWCDDCEVVFQAHGGWTEETKGLATIRMLCSGCYERARVRNTRTDVTLDDLAELRWKCHTCEEWHTGPCLDFSYDSPYYWSNDTPKDPFVNYDQLPDTFLDEDICVLDGEDFFVRGIIHLPIIGTAETFRWGVWGSLSKDNFKKLLSMFDDPKRVELPPMFSWLSNRIEEYEDTDTLHQRQVL